MLGSMNKDTLNGIREVIQYLYMALDYCVFFCISQFKPHNDKFEGKNKHPTTDRTQAVRFQMGEKKTAQLGGKM